MATLKVYLAPNETVDDAREHLRKALLSDPKESFSDPVMLDIQDILIKRQGDLYKSMLERIFEVLEE